MLRSLRSKLKSLGRQVRVKRRAVQLKWRFSRQFNEFCRLSRESSNRSCVRWEDRFPCLADATSTTAFDPHYIYHCAWAARVLAELKPPVHVDISSSLYFCTQISAFFPVRFYDYRPAPILLSNLQSARADLTALPFPDRSIGSMSCMHVVEHIGLGRYGDPLGPDDDLKAMAELARVLSPGGSLLFVVPVGKPKVVFNAHRIYSYEQVVSAFGRLELKQFALIPDNPLPVGLIVDADPADVQNQNYACGCFLFRRSK